MCKMCEKAASEAACREAELTRLGEEKAQLSDENAKLTAKIGELEQRIAQLQKALFGPRSERLVDRDGDPPGQQVFEELLGELADLNARLSEEASVPKPPERRSGREKRKPRNLEELAAGADLPRKVVEVEPPENDRLDPVTGDPLKRIEGDRVVRLAWQPGGYLFIEYHYPKYVNPVRPLAGVIQAPALNSAVLQGSYDESFMAKVVYDKCVKHLPLYRQAEELGLLNIDISRQTLSRLYIRAAEVLRPLWLLMKEAVVAGDIVFTDDTPVKMLERGKGRTVTGRMWVYIGGGGDPPFRVFEFTVDRSKKRPREFLEGFRGYIHADAYTGYDGLFEQDGVHECACWMHVRRKYMEAVDAPEELRSSVLRPIRHLYMYERFIRTGGPDTMSPAEREKLALWIRREKISPLIDSIFERTRRALIDREVLPGSDFAKAIGYMHNLGEALKTFTADPRLRPDNGESERAIRPLAIGRKNWLFAGCREGGDATGILLSLTQTCRTMDINPFAYIEDVLRRISDHPQCRLGELLPGNWKPAEEEPGQTSKKQLAKEPASGKHPDTLLR